MADFYEIDFLEVHKERSGDAISMRYEQYGLQFIHVVDGGYAATGETLAANIKEFYGNPIYIDHVVVTHPDQDHAEGLQTILNTFAVGTLWMLLPWNYIDELIGRFTRYTNPNNLKRRLREAYPYLVELEKIAQQRGITIREPLQGAQIGAFTIMAPTRSRYLDLVVTSTKTPEERAQEAEATVFGRMTGYLVQAGRLVKSLAYAAWGQESFPPGGTSNENEMSVVQHARFGTRTVVLTADTGCDGLNEAADYAPLCGLSLPGGPTQFQMPHHGGRHNVSTEVLNRWFGAPLAKQPPPGTETFTAIVSAARNDDQHPRKVVVRAFMHRGAKVVSTDDGNGTIKRISWNAPDRPGWGPVTPLSYPDEMEE